MTANFQNKAIAHTSQNHTLLSIMCHPFTIYIWKITVPELWNWPLIIRPLWTSLSHWSILRQNSRKGRVLARHWITQFIKHYKNKCTVFHRRSDCSWPTPTWPILTNLWLHGIVDRASDLRSGEHEFGSKLVHCQIA